MTSSPSSCMRFALIVGVYCLSLSAHIRLCLAQDCSASNPSVCDKHERCPVWRDEGECMRSRTYMSKYCPVSCAEDFKKQGEAKMDLSCQDEHPQCEEWAKEGECESNVDMLKFCKKSCEACDGSKCRDGHKSCAFWAELGECESNPKYMLPNCEKSCKVCDPMAEEKKAEKEEKMTAQTTDSNKQEFPETLGFGVLQVAEGAQAPDTIEKINGSIEYMNTAILTNDVRSACKNKFELCSFWAGVRECDNNEGWMRQNCGPACQSCHLPTSW